MKESVTFVVRNVDHHNVRTAEIRTAVKEAAGDNSKLSIQLRSQQLGISF